MSPCSRAFPGIGRKTAERVIIEMRDSVQETRRCPRPREGSRAGPGAAQSPQSEAFSALIALGLQAPGGHAALEVGR